MGLYKTSVRYAVAPDVLAGCGFAKVGLLLPENFYFLVSATTSEPIPIALSYLREKCLTRLPNADGKLVFLTAKISSEHYARDLCDFLDFLDSKRKSVEHVTPNDLDQYLNSMNGQISANGREFALDTMTRRMSTVKNFILWAQKNGRLKNRFSVDIVTTRTKSVSVLEPDIKIQTEQPTDMRVRHIDLDHCSRLLDLMGPMDLDNEDTPVQATRDRLMGECAFQAGLRVSEVVNLKVRNILRRDLNNKEDFSTISIKVLGKGSKWRDVPFPVWLLRLLHSYILTERARIVRHRQNTNSCFKDPTTVFVHSMKARGTQGQPISAKHLDCNFAKARVRLIEELESTGGTQKLQ